MFTNAQSWKASLLKQQADLDKSIEEAALGIAQETRNAVRKRIPPGDTTSDGMTNPFPGYAATGRVKSSITTGDVVKGGDTYTCRVGLDPNAGPLEKTKAFVHEYGATIKPKRGPYLVFKVPPNGKRENSGRSGDRYTLGSNARWRDGGWRRVKRVQIKAKHFFRAGWEESERRFIVVASEKIKWPRGT